MQHGFTLVDTLMALGIMTAITALALPNYFAMRSNLILKDQVVSMVEIMRVARNRTVASQGGLAYGVSFESDHYVLFGGDPIAPQDTTVYPLINKVEVLEGSGTYVLFDRFTASANETEIELGFPSGVSRRIRIDAIGNISLL